MPGRALSFGVLVSDDTKPARLLIGSLSPDSALIVPSTPPGTT